VFDADTHAPAGFEAGALAAAQSAALADAVSTRIVAEKSQQHWRYSDKSAYRNSSIFCLNYRV
jgi:hypothetical protein